MSHSLINKQFKVASVFFSYQSMCSTTLKEKALGNAYISQVILEWTCLFLYGLTF